MEGYKADNTGICRLFRPFHRLNCANISGAHELKAHEYSEDANSTGVYLGSMLLCHLHT